MNSGCLPHLDRSISTNHFPFGNHHGHGFNSFISTRKAMYLFIFWSLGVQFCTLRIPCVLVYENFAVVEGPFDENCPVLYGGECFKIFTPDTAVTADAGELYCQRNLDDLGRQGHLADIHGEDHFRNLASYVRAHDEPLPIILDPNILLAMTYDTATGTARYRDNTIVTNLYWGERGRPASWGSRLVLRVSTKTSMAKLQNIGNDDTRFKRIMCQYIEK